ncbi:thiamine phosphate synthase [Methylobacterium sp. WSM2598]|uniref:thiamine phosphate synthase n=1 Tax=Methylobacterium sp. WSM2598 TaxID=398261 RepID=UPI0003614671|nr:thiamine phosphate synthase [Methylobacterium sp. WSM2598]
MPTPHPPKTRLVLIAGPESGPDLAARLSAACRAGDVAAVILRLAAADERALIRRVKDVAPAVQEAGAALVVACDAPGIDPVALAARAGADGVHAGAGEEPGEALRDLRERLRDGRILGVGSLTSRHAAMEAGEAGADYVLFGEEPRATPAGTRALAAWWAEIFETPCVALARSLDAVADLAATGAEFVALDPALWEGPALREGAGTQGPDAVAQAQARLAGGAA